MKRFVLVAVAFAAVCAFTTDLAWAGPGCCKSKQDGKDTKLSSLTACSMGEFPHLTMLVGDKEFDCPMAADKAAEEKGAKVRFAVAGEQFDCKDKAMTALADVSERFVGRYTTIAAVVDGKTIYCAEDMGGCCKSKTASAEGSSCSKSKATLASDKSEGSSCSKSKAALASDKSEGSSCSKSKAALASDKSEGSSCSKSKAALASDKSKGSSCCKSKAALAKAEGKSCASACKKESFACVSKDEFAKAIKTDGAKFIVLARNFDSYDDAVKARAAAMDAMKVVKMTYVVEGKEVDCSSKVCPMAKKAGKVEYVIGETKTNCEVSARISMAKAQFDAAKKAADQKLAKI
ncbi:hypothetical protein B7486_04460 [cyanobacterium TDX16]|nr:hypothetical protein B7486_04460 [cyanobacterium TDX16]